MLEFDVAKGRTYKTGLIEIQGNDITRQNVIRRQIRIRGDITTVTDAEADAYRVKARADMQVACGTAAP